MIPYRYNTPAVIGIAILFVCALGYGLFEARTIVYGPNIILAAEKATVSERIVLVQGQAERITELRINGRVVSVTEDGIFGENIALTEGYNRILIAATDKFGRTEEKVLELVYQPLTHGVDATLLERARTGVE